MPRQFDDGRFENRHHNARFVDRRRRPQIKQARLAIEEPLAGRIQLGQDVCRQISLPLAIKQSKEPSRFEFTVEAKINSVPFLGKPDARWVTPVGIPVVHDFKVNGYCSKYTTSPCRSYMRCRDGYLTVKPSKSHDTEHREFLAYQHGDLTINTTYLEAANTAWADQLSLYGWALGERIGDENVVLSIHQIVAKPTGGRPQLRVASYRARVQASYQHQLADRLSRCWNSIADGHIFLDLSREDSDARCEVLDETAVGLQSDGSSREEYFNEATRDRYRG